MTHRLTLVPLAGSFAICRLEPDSAIPAWAVGPFVSVTRTAEELVRSCVPTMGCHRACGANADGGRGGLQVRSTSIPRPGVLASVTGSLAEAGIGLFAVSTFDTDYLLVQSENADRAVEILRRAGHAVGE